MRAFCFLCVACGSSYNPAREAIDAARVQENTDPQESDWSCPMHPEVASDSEGDCPVCGMPLIQEGT